MAIIDNYGKIRGKAGPLIYRRYRDKNILQAMPRKFKQTTRSILASGEFGMSSSTAGVIRRAFEPAFLFRDAEAPARTTALVRKSIFNSPNALVGQRDLHDADLHYLLGMNFNIQSKLQDVLLIHPKVEQDNKGNISVQIDGIKPKTHLCVPKSWKELEVKYRLRIMLVAFDFRKEYYEHLDVVDLDFMDYLELPAQTVQLKSQCSEGSLLMLSMSLIAYKRSLLSQEYVLLNSENFSPCAIIGAFNCRQANAFPEGPIDQSAPGYPKQRGNVHYMPYVGNELRISINQGQNILKASKAAETGKTRQTNDFALRKKISFKKE